MVFVCGEILCLGGGGIVNFFVEMPRSFLGSTLWYRVLNYGICQDILKEQCPRGLLAKNEHFGANCL